MVNKVYLIDIPKSDVLFLQDICRGIAKKIYGETEVLFKTVNSKMAKASLRMCIGKSATFMVLISKEVSLLLNEESKGYLDDKSVFVYSDNDTFMRDALSRYEIEGAEIPRNYSESNTTVKESESKTFSYEGNNDKVSSEKENTPDSGITINVDTEDIDFYKSQVNTLRSEKNIILAELEDLRSRPSEPTSTSNADLVICERELERVKKELEASRKETEASKRALESIIRERDNYRAESENAKVVYKKCQDELKGITDKMDFVTKERDDLKLNCEKIQETLVRTQEEYKSFISEKDVEITELKLSKEKLDSELSIRNKSMEEMQAEIQRDNESIMNFKTSISEKDSRIMELESDKVNINKEVLEKTKNIKELETRLKEADESVEKCISDFSELEDKHGELKQDLIHTKSELERVESENKRIEEKLSKSTDACNNFLAEIENLKNDKKKVENELQENNNKLDKYNLSMEKYKAEIESLKVRNESLESENNTLKGNIEDNLRERNKGVTDIEVKNKEILNLKEKIENLQSKIVMFGDVEREKEEKRKEVLKLESEISELKIKSEARSTSALAEVENKVGINSKITGSLLDKEYDISTSNIKTVFGASYDSNVAACQYIANSVKACNTECIVIDLAYDSFLDSMLGIVVDRNVRNFHEYLDGLTDFESSLYSTSMDNVKYLRLSKTIINEGYLAVMNMDKLFTRLQEYQGKVYINMGVLTGGIKVLLYNTLVKYSLVEILVKSTPINLRTLFKVLSSIEDNKNLSCVCVVPKNGSKVLEIIKNIKQRYKIIDENSVEVK